MKCVIFVNNLVYPYYPFQAKREKETCMFFMNAIKKNIAMGSFFCSDDKSIKIINIKYLLKKKKRYTKPDDFYAKKKIAYKKHDKQNLVKENVTIVENMITLVKNTNKKLVN